MARHDLPATDTTTQPFWDAAREGRLLINRCVACGRAFAYPRPACPRCWSTDVAWEQASGGGVVYTFSVVRQNDLPPFNEQLPYVLALVDLDEGPRLMTRIVGCAPESVRIGMPVRVCFESIAEDVTVPYFTPSAVG